MDRVFVREQILLLALETQRQLTNVRTIISGTLVTCQIIELLRITPHTKMPYQTGEFQSWNTRVYGTYSR